MLQPSQEQRDALKMLWQNGQGILAQYFMACREQARDTMEDTVDKDRDEASGEAKAMRFLLDTMSGYAEAKRITKLPDTTT